MSYTPHFLNITHEIDTLMQDHTHTQKDIGYGYRRTFRNKLWFDLIDHKKQDIVMLRVGRGALLVEAYPILYGLFDTVSKVIAKIIVHDIQTLEEKNVAGLFKLLDELPDDFANLRRRVIGDELH